MATSSAADLWEAIAARGGAPRARSGRRRCARGRARARAGLLAARASERFALGLETIYEGYLVHYGAPRLFAPADDDTALLLGDYLYAHGLVRVAERARASTAVADLAELISLCAQLRAEGAGGDGAAWAATAALLGGGLDEPRGALRLRGDARAARARGARSPRRRAVERALALTPAACDRLADARSSSPRPRRGGQEDRPLRCSSSG